MLLKKPLKSYRLKLIQVIPKLRLLSMLPPNNIKLLQNKQSKQSPLLKRPNKLLILLLLPPMMLKHLPNKLQRLPNKLPPLLMMLLLLPLQLQNNMKLHIYKQKNNNKLKKANLLKRTKLIIMITIMKKLPPMLRLKKLSKI